MSCSDSKQRAKTSKNVQQCIKRSGTSLEGKANKNRCLQVCKAIRCTYDGLDGLLNNNLNTIAYERHISHVVQILNRFSQFEQHAKLLKSRENRILKVRFLYLCPVI
jgi:hypothetical protein